MTPLDRAHMVMEGAPEDGALRLRFYEALAVAELFLLLTREPVGERVEPLILQTGDGPVALAFDTEARMGAFVDAPTPYMGLAGRQAIAMLAGQGISLGLNLGVAMSEILLPPDALVWAAGVLGTAPERAALTPARIGPPRLHPDRIAALDARLALMAGVVDEAWLATAVYGGGDEAAALALVGVGPAAEAGVAAALAETHRLSGGDRAVLDILFLSPAAPMLAAFRRQGIGFEIPSPPERPAPGPVHVPDRPPRLR